MNKQLEAFGAPAGRYPATVLRTELLEPALPNRRRAKPYPWRLRLIVKAHQTGTELVVDRDLAADGEDAYALTPARRKTLRAFAERLGLKGTGPAEEIVAALLGLAQHDVTAHVRPGKFALMVTLYRATGASNGALAAAAGETHERLPDPEAQLRERTAVAQGAHEMLMTGLHHANRGLALVSDACWRLRQGEGWVALGYDTVSGYLASPEVSLSRAQFYAHADIWQVYVVDGGCDERRLCAPSKLEVPLAAIKAGTVTADEAIADCEALGLRDLRAKYRGEDDEPSGGGDDPDPSGRLDFPLACRACGVLIADEDGVVRSAGIVYENFRWPEAWSHDQVLAAVAAAKAIT